MYQAPYIDAAGLHLPTYAEILEKLETSYKAIFGSDVYLGNDSQDHQWISIVALSLTDAMAALQLEYNNRAPATAIGLFSSSSLKSSGLSH